MTRKYTAIETAKVIRSLIESYDENTLSLSQLNQACVAFVNAYRRERFE